MGPKPLSPLASAFMEYESELCDLVRAVNLVLLAVEADETGLYEEDGTLLEIALDGLKERAVNLKRKWYESHTRLFSGAESTSDAPRRKRGEQPLALVPTERPA
jgi:hypothetical protein